MAHVSSSHAASLCLGTCMHTIDVWFHLSQEAELYSGYDDASFAVVGHHLNHMSSSALLPCLLALLDRAW